MCVSSPAGGSHGSARESPRPQLYVADEDEDDDDDDDDDDDVLRLRRPTPTSERCFSDIRLET